MNMLNNKGMTLIELIISFAITSAIVVSMFNVVLNYQTEQATEAVKSDIISYKNMITKLIQTDFIKGEVRSVKVNEIKHENNYTQYKFTFKFQKSVDYSGKNKIYKKELTIYASNSLENYIIYEDVNSEGILQPVKYRLPNIGSGQIKTSDQNKITTNLTKFTTINTNASNDTNPQSFDDPCYLGANPNNCTADLNPGLPTFKLDIAISNNELGGDYHIKFVVPLNYPYCK